MYHVYLSDLELADRLGLNSRKTPWSLAARGLIPRPVKVGRLSRWWFPAVCEKLNGTRLPADDQHPGPEDSTAACG
jgi:predicted DNA-binding transcriptional regulator AlpA